jgi:hypothetical protein
MKVKVYSPGGISHDAILPPPLPRCRCHATDALVGAFVFILIVAAAIVAVSVVIAAAKFS